jgi:septum formation protein
MLRFCVAENLPIVSMSRFTDVVLASGSPRRVELLNQIGVRHVVRPADIDESALPGEAPRTYVARLAAAKAEAGWTQARPRPVLAADTAVVLGTELFGKPADLNEGRRMLAALSGRTHRVLTAVALRTPDGLSEALSESEVTFRVLAPEEIDRYWATGEPLGKAGGYAIQGLAATFITRVAGSYSGVMGLPLADTAALLVAAGVEIWNGGYR